jgi:flagellar basal body-associated protein FliL
MKKESKLQTNAKSRKILTVVLLTVAVVLFVVASINLIEERLSFPSTYTMQNEGKFVWVG